MLPRVILHNGVSVDGRMDWFMETLAYTTNWLSAGKQMPCCRAVTRCSPNVPIKALLYTLVAGLGEMLILGVLYGLTLKPKM